MRAATSKRRSAKVVVGLTLLSLSFVSPARAGHTSWECSYPIPLPDKPVGAPTNYDCAIFLNGFPTGVKGVLTSATGSVNVQLTFDVVAGVQGYVIAECTATPAVRTCRDSESIGATQSFPGALGVAVVIHCHVTAPAGTTGSFICRSGFPIE